MNKNLRKFFMILLLGSAASFLFAGQSSKDVKKKEKVKNKKIKIVETVEDEGTFQAKDSDVTVGNVRYFMKASVGSYQLFAINENNSQIPLFSGMEEFTSSFYDLKIGKKIYRLSDSICAVIGTRKNDLGGQIVYVVPKKARVFVKFEHVDHDESIKSEIIKVTATVLNRSKKTDVYALKSVLDTVLGEKAGPHFISSSESAIDSERQVRKMDEMKWLLSTDSETSVQFLFKGADIDEPEVVSLSNKDFISLQNWVPAITKERTFDSVLSYNNSAVCINWNSKILAPGEQCSFVYYMAVATDGAKPDGDAYISWHERKYGKKSKEKYSIKEFEDKYKLAVEKYEAGEYKAAYEIVNEMWKNPENQNERLAKLKALLEEKLKESESQKKEPEESEEVDNSVFYDYDEDLPPGEKLEDDEDADESQAVPPEVKFDVNSIDTSQLNPVYVQGLIDKINSLESVNNNIDRAEILRLHAELDAIIEKLRHD